MTVPASGELSLGKIRQELETSDYSAGPYTASATSLSGSETGLYAIINVISPSYPNGIAPFSMSEWYSYDHAASLPVHFEYDPYLYGDADNEGTQAPTTYGSPTYNAAGYYSFDGTNDAFYYDYDNGINDATGAIEVFVDWDNTQNGVAISFSRDNTSSHRGFVQLLSSTNQVRFFIRRSFSGDQINLLWDFSGASGKYHIVVNKTADGGSSPDYNYEMYINGVSQGNPDTDSSTGTQGYWFNDVDGFNPYNISVGGVVYNNNSQPTNDFKGDIYRAAIYEDPLSSTIISYKYQQLLLR